MNKAEYVAYNDSMTFEQKVDFALEFGNLVACDEDNDTYEFPDKSVAVIHWAEESISAYAALR